jgi:hypothetical protein
MKLNMMRTIQSIHMVLFVFLHFVQIYFDKNRKGKTITITDVRNKHLKYIRDSTAKSVHIKGEYISIVFDTPKLNYIKCTLI